MQFNIFMFALVVVFLYSFLFTTMVENNELKDKQRIKTQPNN